MATKTASDKGTAKKTSTSGKAATSKPRKSANGHAGKNGLPAGLELGTDLLESQRKTFKIDARLITGSHKNNHRDIFRKDVTEVGYGLFESQPGKPELPPLWSLATSNDAAKRAEFLRVMELYEGVNPADPTIIELAQSIYAGKAGQINPVQLLVKGKKDGKPQIEIIAGHRRCLAVLWLWCKGLVEKPLVECYFVTGNELDLSALQKDENALRKAVNPIIVAQGYQRALNGGATIEQVAEANGVSEQTVERWLQFLELEPKEQQRLVEGKLRHDDAIQIVEDRRKGGEGKTRDGLTADEAATIRPAKGGKRNRKAGKWSTKKIEAAYANPPTDWKVKAEAIKLVLGVILGYNDPQGTAATATATAVTSDGGFTAVLPPDGASFGLLDASEGDEIEVDDNGDLIRKKS
jgi:ParB-like chromosome segregation protein Spo0J